MLPKKKAQKKSAKSPKALLLGLALDNQDGHVRVTSGDNFHLVGGSKDTHEYMTEKALKLNEELHRRGKRLEQVTPKEFMDIADKIQLGGKK